MKTLVFTMVMGALLAAFAVTASAWMGSSGSSSIDTNGVAVVSIHSPSSSLEISSSDRIYLDSNHLWAVNSFHSFTVTPISITAGKTGNEDLYCFDSMSRFCARSY